MNIHKKVRGQEGQREQALFYNSFFCPHNKIGTGARGADSGGSGQFCPRCPRHENKQGQIKTLEYQRLPLLPLLPPSKTPVGKLFFVEVQYVA